MGQRGITRTTIVALLGVHLAAGVIRAERDAPAVSAVADLEALQAAFAEIAERLRPSVVAIHTVRKVSVAGTTREAANGRREVPMPAIGSGVIIRGDGTILSNEHVVQAAEEIRVVLHDGSQYQAASVHADARSDLAIIRIEASGLAAARLGDLSQVKQGHWAFAMGNPFGMGADGTMILSHGIVSAVGRRLRLDPSDSRYYGNLIQTTAPINPGNSGGPLVNIRGEVIGINTAISTRSGANEGVGFAVPMEPRTKAIIETLIRGEAVEYGYLGVKVSTPEKAHEPPEHVRTPQGAVVEQIEPGSPADAGHLCLRDTIVEYDGQAIDDADHLVRLVGATPVGRTVLMTVLRGGRRTQTSVVLSQRAVGGQGEAVFIRWRGMQIAEATQAIRKRFNLPDDATGLVIVEVAPASPAARAGLKAGQRIARFGDAEPATTKELGEMLPGLTGEVSVTLAGQAGTIVKPQ